MYQIISKTTDILAATLIAFVIGVLFSWWAGAAAFLLGMALVFRPKNQTIATSQHPTPEEEMTKQQSLQEWSDWETTHGPNASGITNPSRQD